VRDYVFPMFRANAQYEGQYLLGTSIARPLIAKRLVEIARKVGADAVAHGATGKGNDQVRFEVSVAALAPDLKIIAPLREWEFKSREEELDYAMKHDIPVMVTKKSPYSIDENIWGTSIECGVLEDPMVEPPADAYQRTTAPEDAPDTPQYVEIEFEEGVPVGLGGTRLDPVSLVFTLNDIAGAHGVGRMDLVENRLVGIKSREIYEAPAATVLHFAHSELERLTLEKSVFHMKHQLSNEYANLVYNGLWFTPLKDALDAFVNETQKVVTGTVRVKLYKGNLAISGRQSPFSLYSTALATYTDEDKYDHKASEGFITVFGLPTKTYHQVQQSVGRNGAAPKAAPALQTESHA